MNLKILLPTEIFLDQTVTKVVAEGENGAFCLLPKHLGFVSALAPGIVTYTDSQGREQYVGVGGGVLVKQDAEVRIAALYAVTGDDLGSLRERVIEQFEANEERERTARTAIAELESSFLRRFVELGATADV